MLYFLYKLKKEKFIMRSRSHTFEGEVPKLTKWLYTSSGMFRDACYQFVSMFLLTFVQF